MQEITQEVNRQLEDRIRIFEKSILPALRRNHIVFYQSAREVASFHQAFVRNFFYEEIFPFLAPVPVCDDVQSFLRDNRLYLAVRLWRRDADEDSPDRAVYFVLKIPFQKVPRFIELPQHNGEYYLMYVEDIIKSNLDVIFPGYEVDSSFCIKISRDADIMIEEAPNATNIVEQVKRKLKKRKIGAVSRFVYDRHIPYDFLMFLVRAFHIDYHELVPGDSHLNLENLRDLPNPNRLIAITEKPQPMKLRFLDAKESIFRYVAKSDLLLHYPYHSFEHFLHFLIEAVHDPYVTEIMLTQYRVAENSAVINALISAAHSGKQVTVFVELKARFDEEHNLATAQLMESAGINIIYSIPGLKVHAKVALVLRSRPDGKAVRSYAYISTGNFNEKTATLYADIGLFTTDKIIVDDLHKLFLTLKGEQGHTFRRLLVARFNLIDELNRLIDDEIRFAQSGRGGRIILKMNALQDPLMIDRLYEASQAGVSIDLIIRGICCLVPEQPYSCNIRVTRVVDSFLEHARVWYFGGDGEPRVYIGSPDWMRRNLYRRIEAVVPVLDPTLRSEIIDMLDIQLRDNRKACFINARQENVFKHSSAAPVVRAQYTFYNYLKNKNETKM
jgi:polyphosphate kinase